LAVFVEQLSGFDKIERNILWDLLFKDLRRRLAFPMTANRFYCCTITIA